MDVSEIQQSNDIESVGIPADLLAMVHEKPSVDPTPEQIAQAEDKVRVDVEKVAEENPQSRFRILNSPIKKPGTCFVCKSSGGDGRQFIDFNRTLEWFGVVYLCTFCVQEICSLIGFAPSDVFEGAIDGLQSDLSNVDDRYVETKVKLDAAMVLLRDHLNGNCSPVIDPVEISEAELVESGDAIQDGEGSESSSSEHDESSIGTESDSDESDPIKGPDDISGSSGDDEPESKPVGNRRRSTKSTG